MVAYLSDLLDYELQTTSILISPGGEFNIEVRIGQDNLVEGQEAFEILVVNEDENITITILINDVSSECANYSSGNRCTGRHAWVLLRD
jgi:hypothetical protein